MGTWLLAARGGVGLGISVELTSIGSLETWQVGVGSSSGRNNVWRRCPLKNA